MDEWRSGSPAAEEAWNEAGTGRQSLKINTETGRQGEGERGRQGDTETRGFMDRAEANGEQAKVYVEGMLVRHDVYGQGRVTQVSGYGIMRKIKVRFSTHGEKTFVAEKAKLAILVKAK